MIIPTHSIGIDISKDTFDASCFEILAGVLPKRKAKKKFNNTQNGFKAFQDWLGDKAESIAHYRVAMEATGVYHQNLAYHLHEAGYSVSILLPNMVCAYAKSLNQQAKTDSIDADIIGRFGAERVLPKWQPANTVMLELKGLSRQREALVKSRTMMKNRIHATRCSNRPSQAIISRYEEVLELYDTQIAQIEQEYKVLVKMDERLRQSVEIITSIPHVGIVTAIAILAETDGFNLFKNCKQLTKFSGLDVKQKQSGTSVNGTGKISKCGNSHLRGALYMAAMGLSSRTDTVFSAQYQRIVERTGKPMKGIVAVQSKLLTVIFALHTKKQKYNAEIHALRA